MRPADGSKAAAEVEGKVWLAPGLSDQQLRTALQVRSCFQRSDALPEMRDQRCYSRYCDRWRTINSCKGVAQFYTLTLETFSEHHIQTPGFPNTYILSYDCTMLEMIWFSLIIMADHYGRFIMADCFSVFLQILAKQAEHASTRVQTHVITTVVSLSLHIACHTLCT